MKEYSKKQKITAYVLLALIILVQLVYTTYTFTNKKEGFHSDEIWSYGLSNSYYKPFLDLKPGIANSVITQEGHSEDDLENINQWISSDVLKDYLTVQEGERFSYGSVYSNQTLDNHPPLYYFLIHTVSSFFPNSFSWFFGYALNCVLLIVTQIYIYKISRMILKGDSIYLPLAVCALYAGCIGALSTFIFIRIYAMLAMLVTMHLYYQLRLIKYGDEKLKKLLPSVLITAFIGFMTEYLFIAAAGIATACVCIITLCRKKPKRMFVIGLSMTAALALFAVVYPAALTQVSGYHLDRRMTLLEQTKRMLSYVTYSTCGFSVSVYKSSFYAYVIFALVIIAIIAVPLCFLFRKEEWFKNFVTKVRSSVKYFFKEVLPQADLCLITLFVVIIAHIITVAAKTDIIGNGKWVMRYVMPIIPLAAIAYISAVNYLVSWIPKVKKYCLPVMSVFASGVLVYMNITYDCYFLFEQPENTGSLAETTENKRCIVIFPQNNTWVMTCFSEMLMNCDQCFFTSEMWIKDNDISDVFSLNEGETAYLVMPGEEETEEVSHEDNSENESLDWDLEKILPESEYKSSEDITKEILSSENVSEMEELYQINVQGADYLVYEIR